MKIALLCKCVNFTFFACLVLSLLSCKKPSEWKITPEQKNQVEKKRKSLAEWSEQKDKERNTPRKKSIVYSQLLY